MPTKDFKVTISAPNLIDFVGDSGSGGVTGFVPAPAAGDAAANKYLKADGTWSTLSGGALDANKTVSGAVNGSNVTFTLPSAPQGQIMLYASGVRLKPTDDYSISGDTITMVTAPTTGTVLLADYGVGVGVSDGDKGDITVSSNGTVWTVDNGLAATKIADGTVTDVEFQYLGGVTSDIQTQINAKAPLASPTFTGTVKGISIPFTFAISDETTAITTGTSKITFRVPYACTLTEVRASLSTASSSGIPTFDINKNGTTVLSTKLTIDENEKTSVTATTAAVISVSSFSDDDEVTVDVDVAGTGATGAKITMYLTRV